MNKYPYELIKYSSFGYYAFGESDFIITPPQCYLDLGSSKAERQERFRQMVDLILKHDFPDATYWEEYASVSNPFWVCERYEEIVEKLN